VKKRELWPSGKKKDNRKAAVRKQGSRVSQVKRILPRTETHRPQGKLPLIRKERREYRLHRRDPRTMKEKKGQRKKQVRSNTKALASRGEDLCCEDGQKRTEKKFRRKRPVVEITVWPKRSKKDADRNHRRVGKRSTPSEKKKGRDFKAAKEQKQREKGLKGNGGRSHAWKQQGLVEEKRGGNSIKMAEEERKKEKKETVQIQECRFLIKRKACETEAERRKGQTTEMKKSNIVWGKGSGACEGNQTGVLRHLQAGGRRK